MAFDSSRLEHTWFCGWFCVSFYLLLLYRLGVDLNVKSVADLRDCAKSYVRPSIVYFRDILSLKLYRITMHVHV